MDYGAAPMPTYSAMLDTAQSTAYQQYSAIAETRKIVIGHFALPMLLVFVSHTMAGVNRVPRTSCRTKSVMVSASMASEPIF